MLAIVADQDELTIRPLFYLMGARALIDTTETEYNHVVIRLALQLRRAGAIPYGIEPRLYGSVHEALTETANLYRRDYWRHADRLVEVWCEKETICTK